jgi:hypothetical protein
MSFEEKCNKFIAKLISMRPCVPNLQNDLQKSTLKHRVYECVYDANDKEFVWYRVLLDEAKCLLSFDLDLKFHNHFFADVERVFVASKFHQWMLHEHVQVRQYIITFVNNLLLPELCPTILTYICLNDTTIK